LPEAASDVNWDIAENELLKEAAVRLADDVLVEVVALLDTPVATDVLAELLTAGALATVAVAGLAEGLDPLLLPELLQPAAVSPATATSAARALLFVRTFPP
jgi:hypothetical protein